MNSSLTSDEDDPSEDPLKRLLRNAYRMHQSKLDAVNIALSSVQDQMDQLEHDNNKLESAIRSKTEENEQLLSENKELEVQLRALRQRPPPVCKECDGLRFKVKALSGIREQIFKVLGGSDYKSQGRLHLMDTDTITNTLHSIYTQALDSEMLTENPDQEIEPSPPKAIEPSVSSRSKDSPNKPSKADKVTKVQQSNDVATSKESAVRKVGAKDAVGANQSDIQGIEVGYKKDEISPKPKRNLRLPKRMNKRQRVTEECQPSKRIRSLQNVKESSDKKGTSFHGMLHSDTKDFMLQSEMKAANSAPPRVLVADTCDMSMDTSHAAYSQDETGDTVNKKGAERKIAPIDRPDVIIPETVRMDVTDDELDDGQEDDDVNSQSQPLSGQLTVRNLNLSPPSLASTPVCSNRGYPLNLGESPPKENVQDLLEEARDALFTDKVCDADPPKRRPFPHYPSTDSPSYDEDISSDAGSPVFKRNRVVSSGTRQQNVQSPSLFDEDDADLDSIPSTLPPPPAGVFAKNLKGKKSLHNQSKNASMLEMQDKSNHDLDGTHLSVSVQSNPSPSMLSGKILSKIKNSGNSEWLSTTTSKSSPQAKRAFQQGKSPIKPKDKLSGHTKPATHGDNVLQISSPIRMTRSTKSSQDKRSSTLNTSKGSNLKSLKQTTITNKFFQPVITKLSTLEGFNGGRLAGSQQRKLTKEEQELQDLEEAMQRSLNDIKGRQSQDDLGFTETEVEMTQPKFTSTPFNVDDKVPPRRSSSDDSTSSDNTMFKKPSTPTTPKHRRPKEHDQELRRSPRLKDEISQDDTIDPTRTSPETQRRSKKGKMHRKNTSSVNRSLDLSKHEITNQSLQANSELLYANGSLGPGVRLSEWDPEVSAMATSPDGEQYLEPISLLDIYSAESENRTQSVKTQQTVITQKGATKAGVRQDSDSDDEVELTGGSVVFGSTKTRQRVKGHKKEKKKRELPKVTESLDDSFDRVPKKKEDEFKYNGVVRKKAERDKLQTYVCNECDNYYGDDNATEEEIKERMKNCRHKARYVPPGTPENLWTVGFPDTQECEERGYMNKTQHKASKFRRKKPYKSLFDDDRKSAAASPKTSGKRPPVVGDVTALFEGDDTEDDV